MTPDEKKQDDEKWGDNPDSHSCRAKARELNRRTNIQLGIDSHDVVSQMCNTWGTKNADEFYAVMNSKSDEELRDDVLEAQRQVKKKKLLKKGLIEREVDNYAYT